MLVILHALFAESESGSGKIEDYYDVHTGATNLDEDTSDDENSSCNTRTVESDRQNNSFVKPLQMLQHLSSFPICKCCTPLSVA